MVAEMQDVYVANGYVNRVDYFKHLSAEYDVDISIVALCAELMGESEDFDGLLRMLEDAAETHKKHLILLQKLKDEIAELNGDWVCDWSDKSQQKRYFYYSYESSAFFISAKPTIDKIICDELYMTFDSAVTIHKSWSKEDLYLALFGCEL